MRLFKTSKSRADHRNNPYHRQDSVKYVAEVEKESENTCRRKDTLNNPASIFCTTQKRKAPDICIGRIVPATFAKATQRRPPEILSGKFNGSSITTMSNIIKGMEQDNKSWRPIFQLSPQIKADSRQATQYRTWSDPTPKPETRPAAIRASEIKAASRSTTQFAVV